MISTYVTFIICSLINVVISTLKSIITIKGSKFSAATINSISYAINTVVIVFTASDFALWVKVIISATTNFIGVYFGIWVLDKFKKKKKVWEIVATIKNKNISCVEQQLNAIPGVIFNFVEASGGKYTIYYIYTHSKDESKQVKDILVMHDAYTMVHEETVKL